MEQEKPLSSNETSSCKSVDSISENISSDRVKNKPGRKPCNDEPMSKRLAQNRQAQRNFRERKENHLKDLEERIRSLQANEMKTRNVLQQLHQENLELKVENRYLKATLQANQIKPNNGSNVNNSLHFSSNTYSNTNGSEDNLLYVLNQKLKAEKKELNNPSPYSNIFNHTSNHKLHLKAYEQPTDPNQLQYSAEFNSTIFSERPNPPQNTYKENPNTITSSLHKSNLTLAGFSPDSRQRQVRLPSLTSLTRGIPSSSNFPTSNLPVPDPYSY